MKLSKKQKKSIENCLLDLECYYATCGKKEDYKNFETLLTIMRAHKIKTPEYIDTTVKNK